MLVVIAGAALLFGDGIITPAISVLSALEGVELAAPGFKKFGRPGDVRRPARSLRDPAPGHGRHRQGVRPRHGGLVRRHRRARRVAHRARNPDVLAALSPKYGSALLRAPRRARPAHPRHRRPRGDGRRGPLRRHGPLRRAAHPRRVARPASFRRWCSLTSARARSSSATRRPSRTRSSPWCRPGWPRTPSSRCPPPRRSSRRRRSSRASSR